MAENILLFDIGSTFTKLTAVNTEARDAIFFSSLPTTLDTGVEKGVGELITAFRDDFPKADFDCLFAGSAAGGLKMAAVGLTRGFTAKAAEIVCLGAGAKVIMSCAGELSPEECEKIQQCGPDIILLAGGTDGGDKTCVIQNSRIISELDLPGTVILYAGNKSARRKVTEILRGKQIKISENILPDIQKPAFASPQNAIREIFIENIIRSKGMDKLPPSDEPVMPTPLAVLNGAELFSEVIGSELVVVDIGGATTDVVSIGTGRPTRSNVVLRGLREPRAKRTVEADIGMRYSVKGIGRTLENPGIGLQQWIERVSSDITVTPQTPAEKEFDMTLAAQAVSVSVERHCGHLREEYTPQGRVYVQEGKDLTDVGWLIGTGGVIKELSESRRVFSGLAQNSTGLTLMPADPDILCDKSYIFCAMGLLSTREPACAAVILKKEFDL